MSTTDAAKKQFHFLIRYVLQSAAIIVICAVLIRVFLISSYVMSGASMLPSVWPGDFLIGFRWSVGEPRRGDVVALRCPGERERTCLKRVVAVAGDRVEFADGRLVVNGQPGRLKPLNKELALESVGGRSWVIWQPSQPIASRAPLIVPPQQVYLLNDKRSDEEDSRSWGPVAQEYLEAKVKYVWLSLEWYKGQEVRTWPAVRWRRLLRSID